MATFTGDEFDNTLTGTAFGDDLYGLAGNDFLDGNEGSDTLLGGAGNDRYRFFISDGDDRIVEESGTLDRVIFSDITGLGGLRFERANFGYDLVVNYGSGDRVTLVNHFADQIEGGNTRDEVERIDFQGGATFLLSAGFNFTGTIASDVLTGLNFADTLVGLAGNDDLRGGGGSDRYVFSTGDGNDYLREAGTGTGADDRVAFTNVATASALRFSRTNSGYNLLIHHGNGDSVELENHFADQIEGTTGRDEVENLEFSNGGLLSLAGGFNFTGTATGEVISGLNFADTIVGLTGNDDLRGFGGSDRYLFTTGDGNDFVREAGTGTGADDRVVLSNVGGLGAVRFSRVNAGYNLVIHYGSGDSVELENHFADQIEATSSRDEVETLEFSAGATFALSGGFNFTGTAVADTLRGLNFADTLVGLTGNDDLGGSGGDDRYVFTTGDGNDYLREAGTGTGDDRVVFTDLAGASELRFSRVNGGYNLVIHFGSGDSVELENHFADQIEGTSGRDEVENIQFSGGGLFSLAGGFNFTGTVNADVLVGLGFSDTVVGLTGNDDLSGGAGSDRYVFTTGDGQDYLREAGTGTGADDRVVLTNVGGLGAVRFSRVNSGFNLVIHYGTGDSVQLENHFADQIEGVGNRDEVETLEFSGGATFALSGGFNFTGTAVADTLRGLNFADTLIGLAGNDDLAGGGGDDRYEVAAGDGNDYLREAGTGTGDDTLAVTGASSPLALGFGRANFDYNLVITYGASDSTELENHFADEIEGASTRDEVETLEIAGVDYRLNAATVVAGTHTGTPQNDIVVGRGGSETLVGQGGDDVLAGLAGNDSLTGGAGADSFLGGAGADTYRGGDGDDVFLVDDAGDQVIEFTGGGSAFTGVDTVRTTLAAYTLTGSVEVLIFAGAAGSFTGVGNNGDNSISGGNGSDTLDGRGGVDTLVGGLGNDFYIVDRPGETVVDTGGQDTVRALNVHTLADGIEDLVQGGVGDFDGTGNTLANQVTGNNGANGLNGLGGNDRLVGNGGADTLDGGAGNDTMTGGTGDDVYVVDSTGDMVIEAFGSFPAQNGIDTVRTALGVLSIDPLIAVENLVYSGSGAFNGFGNNANNRITGGAGVDTLGGANGADTLVGGVGADSLTGGAGADTFDYDFFSHSRSSTGIDTVADFASGVDEIDLSGIDANTLVAGDQMFTFVGGVANYTGAAGQLFVETVAGQIRLRGDVNGGGVDFEIILLGAPVVLVTDIVL